MRCGAQVHTAQVERFATGPDPPFEMGIIMGACCPPGTPLALNGFKKARRLPGGPLRVEDDGVRLGNRIEHGTVWLRAGHETDFRPQGLEIAGETGNRLGRVRAVVQDKYLPGHGQIT